MSGDATEDSFAALANEKSDDGNGTTGGLYENVYPGQMVSSFNDWCFDESRQTGNTGKFCANCGSPKPAPAPAEGSWVCSCGTSNTGKFCCNCGNPKPAPAPAKCSQCGWTPVDPAHPPKFCPECGKPFGQ